MDSFGRISGSSNEFDWLTELRISDAPPVRRVLLVHVSASVLKIENHQIALVAGG